MNKKIFKLITFFILIIFLVNTILPNNIVFALNNADSMNPIKEEQNIEASEDFFQNIIFDGTFRLHQDSEPEAVGFSEGSLMIVPNILIYLTKLVAEALNGLINCLLPESIVNYPGTDSSDYINDPKYKKEFTLDKLFFDEIEVLNANFFDFDKNDTSLNTIIKKNVQHWYVIMSSISLIILLGIMIYLAINMVLVYAGIRTPQKHATIKEIMTNIVISVAMIFLLPLILNIIANFNDFLVKTFSGFRINLLNSYGEENFEMMVHSGFKFNIGMDGALVDLMYILLVIIYLRFIVVYLKRFYTLGFLTVISPFITVTFALDKLNDDKSQVLGRFYREYFFACFVRPLHCVMYIVYIGALGAIAITSPLMGLFLLSLFGRVEKIIKGMFDSRDLMVIRSSEEFFKGGKVT